MHRPSRRRLFAALMLALACCLAIAAAPAAAQAPAPEVASLDANFDTLVRPFLEDHCLSCHGKDEPEAKLDLSTYDSADTVRSDIGHWELILDRLRKREMPPEDPPPETQRRSVIDWITELRRREAQRNAGDPGVVLARRLSHAEYDYTIHDLTGADIRPTREFPVDSANQAGFTNSGESLTMSPALLKKYLTAAESVAEHLVLTPSGFQFAPHPMVTVTDRDKFCVHRIVDFYQRQPTDLADYFFAAWRLRTADDAESRIREVAEQEKISAKYLTTVWRTLADREHHAGPLAKLRRRFEDVPANVIPEDARAACDALARFVKAERERLKPEIDMTPIKGFENKQRLQPTIVWFNQQVAANRRRGKLPEPDGDPATAERTAAIERFCSVFPDTFYVSERGRAFLDPSEQNRGRYLSAGFHLMVGYFRDDQPLYDLILDQQQQADLDRLWRELNFVTQAPLRQFRDFVYFERAESTRYFTYAEFDFARPEDDDLTSPEKMRRVAELFVARAERNGVPQSTLAMLEDYFQQIDAEVRAVERDREAAQPRHLEELLALAARAWRRPLTSAERDQLIDFYDVLRNDERLPHEAAIRDVLTMVLVSPRFSYRVSPPPPGDGIAPLGDIELANRLSYFLWSSMPDEELLELAVAGKLRDADVLAAQTRRMLGDPRSRRLAIEFGGNWLGFRQFRQHKGVDRNRFENFTDPLRDAMFEEPVRWLTDLIQHDGSILQMLDADHTFVNAVLASHYGMPESLSAEDGWVRIDNARQYGRGGLLPMAVFLTKNSPGQRTSPVKRGFWVVRQLLGEHIPAPPADVPELPEDEATLEDMSLREALERHRAVPSCAACHRKFDSIGLAFEGYGPIGQRRTVDLGGRPIDDRTEFPNGDVGIGLGGLKDYLRQERQDEFIDTFCRRLLAYALGRSLMLSDENTIELMREQLMLNDYRIGAAIQAAVASPQFRNRRQRDFVPANRR